MTYNSIKNYSFSISLLIHFLFLILFFFIKFTIEYPPRDYIELGFGNVGSSISSGAEGTQLQNLEQIAKEETTNETTDTRDKVENVELPVTKNTTDNNVVSASDNAKDKTVNTKTESKQTDKESNVTTPGRGNKTSGDGSLGYEIDWGGKGIRKIYSYIIPAYPEGVQKEIDIRLRFTILPDGTVGTIFPITKADTRLENAAIAALRQWRFEALSRTSQQVEQSAIIVFPYRLQ